MGAHALLSASGSHKWLHCPASARIEERYPDQQSAYTLEGTLAHSVGELKLRKLFTIMAKSTYTKTLNKLKKDELYDTEIDTCTDTYRDYVNEIALSYDSSPQVLIEKRVDYSDYAPEGFGTADCIIIGGKTLHVIDYKHGKGVAVSAENNPQMMLYGLGAMSDFRLIYEIDLVVVHVVQPRLDNLSRWEIPAEDLLCWGEETVEPAAKKAFEGVQEFHAGTHCNKGFCKAKKSCKARAEHFMQLQEHTSTPPNQITPTYLSTILQMLAGFKAWASDVQDYALEQLLEGVDVPGYKVVEGTSRRVFQDLDTAIESLQTAGYDEALFYERKPISLSQMEKVVGKKEFGTLLQDQVGGLCRRQNERKKSAPQGVRRRKYERAKTLQCR